MYCVWYGFERAIVEPLRTDSLMPTGNIRISFVVSVIICIGSAITLFVIYKKRRTAVKDLDYSAMFKDELEDQPQIEQVTLEENINE